MLNAECWKLALRRSELDTVKRPAGDVPQLHGDGARAGVNPYRAEELKAVARRPIVLHFARDSGKADVGAEGPVKRVRAIRPSVQWPGDELPERVELGETCARRIVVMRGAVVNVRGNPHCVAHA